MVHCCRFLYLGERLRLIPGIRLNHDIKKADFNRTVTGGLQTDDPVLLARQRSVLRPQRYKVDSDDSNFSGQFTAAYAVSEQANLYTTYARSFKSLGVNLSGIPNDADGNPALEAATIRPERVNHFEVGLKSSLLDGRISANLNLFDTIIDNFQVNVVNANVGILRGFLANAKEVEVKGIEAEVTAAIGDNLSVYANATFSDGDYNNFQDAPCPIELTGSPGGGVCDISGTSLPGVSSRAVSFGADYSVPVNFLGVPGDAYFGIDGSYRSAFSSSATSSEFLVVEGYTLVNARAGFRAGNNWEIFGWARNVFKKNYFDFQRAQPGNSGMLVGQLGDPRTAGVTLKLNF
ncbi:MAG: TonB-dependent receptor [Pseudomonadales bacterium]|nr:TonB-dependent receptor [Pseudomonadales bacterium]